MKSCISDYVRDLIEQSYVESVIFFYTHTHKTRCIAECEHVFIFTVRKLPALSFEPHGDFLVFHPASMTRCTDQVGVWKKWVDFGTPMRYFTPVMVQVCGFRTRN